MQHQVLWPWTPLDNFSRQPPDKFDGKKDNFEEFSFKLKADLLLMGPGYAKAFKELEDSPDTEITDAASLDAEGDPKPALINQTG